MSVPLLVHALTHYSVAKVAEPRTGFKSKPTPVPQFMSKPGSVPTVPKVIPPTVPKVIPPRVPAKHMVPKEPSVPPPNHMVPKAPAIPPPRHLLLGEDLPFKGPPPTPAKAPHLNIADMIEGGDVV